jgi:hypothetical protein
MRVLKTSAHSSSIVPPITQWTLHAGVVYDGNLDTFVNGAGQPVDVDWKTQTLLKVAFLPGQQSNDVTLAVPGVTTVAKTPVTVLWTKDVEAAIRAAWGVAISGKLYRIDKWDLIPLGVAIPNSIDLELVEAGKQ